MRHFTILLLLCGFLETGAGAAERHRARHSPTSASRFSATAYCRQGRTESGLRSHTGMLAADPRVLPIGSVVRIDGPTAGVYTVMDTGNRVKGRRIDIFIPNCMNARRFGRRTVRVNLVQAR
jgi:3D (Asp-Asp-Asp) domain-containing protein